MPAPPTGWQDWIWTVAFSGVALAAIGAVVWVARAWWARRRPSEALTDEARAGLLEQARRNGWAALRRDLIVLPDGYEDLDLTPRLGLVQGARRPDHSPRAELEMPSNNIIEVFNAARQLFIVGEPGSGKTVLAYTIAEYLDDLHTAKPEVEPIPIVLNLATWGDATTVEDWVVNRLCDPVTGLDFRNPKLARALLTEGRLALILDGLDEVTPTHRPVVLAALNDYLDGVGNTRPIVITCRAAEYTQVVEDQPDRRLALLAARQAQPLPNAVIARNLTVLARGNTLTEPDTHWDTIATAIADSTGAHELAEVLSNPLMLALAAETNPPPGALTAPDNTEQLTSDQIRRNLCHAKVTQALANTTPPEQQWLATIATALGRHNKVTFHPQTTTPPQLPPKLQRTTGLVGGLVGGLVVGLVGGLVVGLVGGLVFGLVVRLSDVDARPARRRFTYSPTRLRSNMADGLVGGLVFGLRADLPIGDSVDPRSALRLSKRSYLASIAQWTLIFGLIFGLVVGLVYGLVYGLVLGLVVGLNDGGGYVVLQWLQRRELRSDLGLIGDPVEVLERMCSPEQRLMRRVGGGFQFRHELLRETVAELDPGLHQLTLY